LLGATRSFDHVKDVDFLEFSSKDVSDSKFILTPEVVEYVGKQHVMLSSLACMLRPATTHFDGELFDYALSKTKDHSALHNWVCLRAHANSLFTQLFLNIQQPVQHLALQPSFVYKRTKVNTQNNINDDLQGENFDQNYFKTKKDARAFIPSRYEF
jgi:hypothetical protein